MAFIPIPNSVKLSMEFVIAGQIVVVTLGFSRPTAVTTSQQDSLNSIVKDWWDADLKARFSNAIALHTVRNYDLSAADAPRRDFALSPTLAGGTGGLALPNNATIAITHYTGSRGRAYRGRNYWPGLASAEQSSATAFNGGLATFLISKMIVLANSAASGGWTHSVLSRYLNNQARVTGVATPVIAYGADSFIDSQRRRLAGRGI